MGRRKAFLLFSSGPGKERAYSSTAVSSDRLAHRMGVLLVYKPAKDSALALARCRPEINQIRQYTACSTVIPTPARSSTLHAARSYLR